MWWWCMLSCGCFTILYDDWLLSSFYLTTHKLVYVCRKLIHIALNCVIGCSLFSLASVRLLLSLSVSIHLVTDYLFIWNKATKIGKNCRTNYSYKHIVHLQMTWPHVCVSAFSFMPILPWFKCACVSKHFLHNTYKNSELHMLGFSLHLVFFIVTDIGEIILNANLKGLLIFSCLQLFVARLIFRHFV